MNAFPGNNRVVMEKDLAWHPAFNNLVGPRPPSSFVSNGASYAPDVIWGVDVTPAAWMHDYHYVRHWPQGNDERARYIADQWYKENLRRCGLGKCLSNIEYFRLRLWGHYAFHYDLGKQPERNVWFWLRLFFGRYITW